MNAYFVILYHATKQKSLQFAQSAGDNEKIAAPVANKLEMDGYLADVLPHQKQEKVNEFKQKKIPYSTISTWRKVRSENYEGHINLPR